MVRRDLAAVQRDGERTAEERDARSSARALPRDVENGPVGRIWILCPAVSKGAHLLACQPAASPCAEPAESC